MLVRFFKQFFNFYFLSSISGAVFSFGIIVFYSHHGSQSDYIQLGVFSGLLGVMPAVIGAHTRSFFIRESSRNESLVDKDVGLLAATFFCMLISLMFVVPVLLMLGEYFEYNMEVIYWVLFVGVAQWFHLSFMAVSHSKKNGYRYFLLTFIAACSAAIFVVGAWFFYDLSWQVRAGALVFGFFCAMLFFLRWYWKKIIMLWSGVWGIKKSLKYSLPLIPYSVAVSAIMFFDRYVIVENFEESIAATYLSLVQLVLVFSIFLDSIYKKVMPVYLSDGNWEVLIKACVVVIPATFIFAFLAPYIFSFLFPDDIVFDLMLFFFMLVSSVLVFSVKLISLIYNYLGDNSYLSMSVVAVNIIAIALMFVFVPGGEAWYLPVVVAACNGSALLVLITRVRRYL